MFRSLILILLIVAGYPQQALAAGTCPAARPIAEARELSLGTEITVHGYVTVPTGVFTDDQSFALQDATGGVYVYRRGGIGWTLALGDEVCVTGRLASYHGLRELSPTSARQIIRLGTGKPPVPRDVDPGAVGAKTEGLLVSITGAVSQLGRQRFRVGKAAVYVDATTGITTAGLTEGQVVTVIGLSSDYDGAQVWPRFQTDISAQTAEPQPTDELTIAQIQGRGDVSPYDGRTGLSHITGCVTGVAARGFYLQSTTPDADPLTSEGIFVYRWKDWNNPKKLHPGDLVGISDFDVEEYYGSTEIVGLAEGNYRRTGACDLPQPVTIPPLADPNLDPQTLYEPYEGMRVSLSFDGSVIGPTARYVSRFPAGDPEIALVDRRSPFYGQRVFAGELPVGRGTIYLSGGINHDLPDVGTGDLVSATQLTGVLGYQFGQYVLLVDGDSEPLSVQDQPNPPATPRTASLTTPPIGPDEFAICTFNVENLFDAVDDGDGDMGDWIPSSRADFRRKIEKRAVAIREDLGGCTVVGVQEVEGKNAVWDALAEAIGPNFAYDYYESADARDITVGILYDKGRVTLRRSEQVQGCSPVDYEVDYTVVRGPRATANPCTPGTFPLFSRPPYLADLTLQDVQGDRSLDVRVIVNHFKSKRGDEAVNLPRRIAQARHVASLLARSREEADQMRAVALGDFNDVLGSQPLAQFSGLVNLYEMHLPPAGRYTYIHNGRAEVLDHCIMTPGLDRYFMSGGPVHINADFPEKRVPDATSHRSSDHDPVLVRFSFRPTGVSAGLRGLAIGALGGMVGF